MLRQCVRAGELVTSLRLGGSGCEKGRGKRIGSGDAVVLSPPSVHGVGRLLLTGRAIYVVTVPGLVLHPLVAEHQQLTGKVGWLVNGTPPWRSRSIAAGENSFLLVMTIAVSYAVFMEDG